MKNIKDVFPNADKDMWFYVEGGYEAILESFEYEILLKKDYGSYQGDTLVLFKDNNKYGFLNFGWGSCSGCDALAACSDYEDLRKLRDGLHNDIVWKNQKEMINYLTDEKLMEQKFWFWESGSKEFLKEAVKILKEE